jgi:hypothetical protein
MAGLPVDETTLRPTLAASNAVIGCRTEDAKRILDALPYQVAVTPDALVSRLLAAGASEDDSDDLVSIASLRWPLLGALATRPVEGVSPLVEAAEDQRLYSRQAPPRPPIGPVLPTSDGGLSEWLRSPAAAADRGAPDSGLASCR